MLLQSAGTEIRSFQTALSIIKSCKNDFYIILDVYEKNTLSFIAAFKSCWKISFIVEHFFDHCSIQFPSRKNEEKY